MEPREPKNVQGAVDESRERPGVRSGSAECARSTAVAVNTVIAMTIGLFFVLSPPLHVYPGLQKVLAPTLRSRTVPPGSSRIPHAAASTHPVQSQSPTVAAPAGSDATWSSSSSTESESHAEPELSESYSTTEPPQSLNVGTAEAPTVGTHSNFNAGSSSGFHSHARVGGDPGVHLSRPGSSTHSHQSGGRKGFLCDSAGRALPIFQLLGAQKTGSTTLYNDLRSTLRLRIDMSCSGPGSWPCKESMWFNWPQDKPYTKLWGLCSQVPPGKLMADFSMGNLKWPYAAQGMHEEYGRLAKDVVLGVALRDPLKRMLSAFAHGVRDGWLYFPSGTPTFEEHCRQFLQEWDRRGVAWLPELWRHLAYRTVDQGLYGYKLRNYLDAGFHPSQFVVYPGNIYLKHRADVANNPLLKALRDRIGDEFFRPAKIQTTKKFNEGHNHGEVTHDLKNMQIRDRLNKEIFGPSNELLVKLLSEGAQQGMTLVGFTGEASNPASVHKWLVDNWDY